MRYFYVQKTDGPYPVYGAEIYFANLFSENNGFIPKSFHFNSLHHRILNQFAVQSA